MAKNLVIVESPAKARTINRYLGREFTVKSSVGHIRDLPSGSRAAEPAAGAAKARPAAKKTAAQASPAEKARNRAVQARRALVARMGVDPERDWAATYEILPGKEKVVEELRRLAQDAETVWLATDMDREGEAIAWHLQQTIGGDPKRFRRVVFNEITQRAIQEAFAHPTDIDVNRVNAQQARRFLDRVVGYEVSPVLWEKVARGLSAGRVQSVAVRLIVEREAEIRAFESQEYWEAFALLGRGDVAWPDLPQFDDDGARVLPDGVARFQVVRDGDQNFRPGDQAGIDEAMARLRAHDFRVASREDRPTSTSPGAPFITSTLQQAASTRLGFNVRRTMSLAQRLYEAGHITYMRTDSTNLSADALAAVREHIGKAYGARYLPAEPNVYASRDSAQEAHEAIRPSDVGRTAISLTEMERDAQRLYELIWRQFVACQMTRAEYTSSSMEVAAGEFTLRIRGRILRFDGYTRVLAAGARREDETELPDFAVGEQLNNFELQPAQHFTRPPPRYTEATLVRELEKRGIGRPSTYAAIISTIQDRGYVTLNNRRFHAERIGGIVTQRLTESFDNLMDYGFTARMEELLDRVALGETGWKDVLNDFYQDFSSKLVRAKSADAGMRQNAPTDTDIACPKCGRTMQLRTASTGVFLGCSGYALPPKERCTATINLLPGDEGIGSDEDDLQAARTRRRCPVCQTPMDSYLIDEHRKLHVCARSPDCSGFEVETGTYRIKGYDGPVIDCDRCGAQMQLKSGRFGKYFGCTNENCRNTRKLLRNGQPAPPKADPVPMPELRCRGVDDTYVLRDGAAGIFLAASGFPKNRETRAPLVSELLPHRAQIDPKMHYLLDAPVADPDGNPAVVRFSRKEGEQYVASEVEGKATGWRAHYREGRWVEVRGEKGDDKAEGPARPRARASSTRTAPAPGARRGRRT